MISFAQNQEDVVLFRLLQFVSEGTYVDVGAGHPVFENVTYGLYLQGWRGVNIEPMSREVELLREVRPDDETIQAAVGLQTGSITLFEAPLENRGATTSNSETVDRYRSAGQIFKEFVSPVITLDEVLSKYDSHSVHIVKIDVEGLEREVLLGASLEKHQPWVLIIEATRPNSQEDSSFEWEPIVLTAGYVMTLFDGLNKFYVREDLVEVKTSLSAPANVFDRWESYSQNQQYEHVKSLEIILTSREEELKSIENILVARDAEIIRAKSYIEELNLYIAALVESIERIKA